MQYMFSAVVSTPKQNMKVNMLCLGEERGETLVNIYFMGEEKRKNNILKRKLDIEGGFHFRKEEKTREKEGRKLRRFEDICDFSFIS